MLFVALFLLLITPITLRTDLHIDHHTDCAVHLRIWGIPFMLRFRANMAGAVFRMLRLQADGQPRFAGQATPGQALLWLRAFLRADRARRFLYRHLHWRGGWVWLSPSFADAAHTALLSGLLQGVLQAFAGRKLVCRLQPDFLAGHTRAHVRCIVFFRLGTIIITAGMALYALARERISQPHSRAKEA